MGSSIEIRQMMAEGKLSIAQFQIEASLKTAHGEERRELLFLLLELTKFDVKNPPLQLLLEATRMAFSESREIIRELRPILNMDGRLKKLLEFQYLLIKDLEERGKLEEMLSAIKEFQITCVENKIPFIDSRIFEFSKKYFAQNFALALQRLSLSFMQKDTKLVSSEIQDLLFVISETRTRNSTQKLQALLDILGSFELQGPEILYRNYCQLRLKGISEQRDFKTILEFIIGFDDFRMLVLVLDLSWKSLPDETLPSFISLLRSQKDFDFLYLEKNFPELKKLFISANSEATQPNKTEVLGITDEDLILEDEAFESDATRTDLTPAMEEEEINLLKQVQYGDFSFNALCDLTVSFLQSDYLRAARSAILKASDFALTEEERMRAFYLSITVLMKLRDYRSALDNSLRAMDLVSTEADLLSLLYVQAECHEKLNANDEARKILGRILEIDGEYRLAKERLEKLNEA